MAKMNGGGRPPPEQFDGPTLVVDNELKTRPKICVLIPAYNEEPVIFGTLDSLFAAGFSAADIYIVDDRSTDKTAEMARSRGVSVFTVPVNGGKARAQIQSIEYFQLTRRYDYAIFLDGDTKIDKNFREEMEKAAIKAPEVALFLGQVKSVPNNHMYSASRAFDYTYGQEVAKKGQHNFNCVFVAPGCASMYRCAVLELLKIDHMTLAEDMDLTMQVHRTGHTVEYVETAVVNTQDPATFKDYHKQTLRWYRGFWQVVIKHGVFHPFKRKQSVDLYMFLMAADAIIFNRVFWLGVLVYLIGWWAAAAAVGIDFLTAGVIAIWVAKKTKRWDVALKFPAYYWINYLNFYAYFRAMIEIFILRKELLAWNKVKRYSFDDGVKKETV